MRMVGIGRLSAILVLLGSATAAGAAARIPTGGAIPDGAAIPDGTAIPSGEVPAFLRPPEPLPAPVEEPSEAPPEVTTGGPGAAESSVDAPAVGSPGLAEPPPAAVFGLLGTAEPARPPESGKVMPLLGVGLPWLVGGEPNLGLHLNGEVWVQLADFLWMNFGLGLQLGNHLSETNDCMDLGYCSTSVMAMNLVIGGLSSRFEVNDLVVLVSLAELHVPVIFGHDTTDDEYSGPTDDYYTEESIGLGLGFRAAVLPWKIGENGYAGFRSGFVPFFFGVESQFLTIEFVAGF